MKSFMSFVTGFLVGGIACATILAHSMANDQDYHDGIMKIMK